MKPSKTVVLLSSLIAALALLAAGIGLFWQDGGRSFSFTTLHGQTVQLFGQGLYRYDTVATAAQEKAQDVVTLFLGVPLLVVALYLYRRGSLRGHLLLAGTLGYFLYSCKNYGQISPERTFHDFAFTYARLRSNRLGGRIHYGHPFTTELMKLPKPYGKLSVASWVLEPSLSHCLSSIAHDVSSAML